ncbi:MAG: hypothetical protein HQL59_13390 [Magnetococcales bacterium]|nr:hypothetical protein [Magnetococcales bacterium]
MRHHRKIVLEEETGAAGKNRTGSQLRAHPVKFATSGQTGGAIHFVTFALISVGLALTALLPIDAPGLPAENGLLLLRVRAYWAMRGHLDWLLSRAQGNPAWTDTNDDNDCINGADCIDDRDKADHLADFLTSLPEVSNDLGSPLVEYQNDGSWLWHYPEEGAGYRFLIRTATTPEDNDQYDHDASDNQDDGRLRLSLQPAEAGNAASMMTRLEQRLPGLRLDLCIGTTPLADRSTPGESCENDGDGTATTGIVTIERLTPFLQ